MSKKWVKKYMKKMSTIIYTHYSISIPNKSHDTFRNNPENFLNIKPTTRQKISGMWYDK